MSGSRTGATEELLRSSAVAEADRGETFPAVMGLCLRGETAGMVIHEPLAVK